MTEQSHTVRLHLLTGVVTYTLADGGLIVRDDKASKRIPYAEIEQIRLISYPAFEEYHAQCAIQTRGHGKIVVRSHHFVSTAEFEDRSATYAPFVRDLCRMVHAANPGARFISGSNALRILWLGILLLALGGAGIWLAVVFSGGADVWQAIAVAAVLIFTAALSLHTFRTNTAKTFDPNDPPVG